MSSKGLLGLIQVPLLPCNPAHVEFVIQGCFTLAFDGEKARWNRGSNQSIYTSPLEFLELCGEAIPESNGAAWKVKTMHHFEVLNRSSWAFGTWIKSCSLRNGGSTPGNCCNGSSKAPDGRTCSKTPLDREILWDREEPSALVMTNPWGALAMEYYTGRFGK